MHCATGAPGSGCGGLTGSARSSRRCCGAVVAETRHRVPRRRRIAWVALLTLTLAVAVGSCVNVATGDLLTGLAGFVSAAALALAAVLIRLNWQLTGFNQDLLDENDRLRAQARETDVW